MEKKFREIHTHYVAHSEMVIVVGIGHEDASSNLFAFHNNFEEGMNPTFHAPAMSKRVSSALVKQPVKEKENSEFNPV